MNQRTLINGPSFANSALIKPHMMMNTIHCEDGEKASSIVKNLGTTNYDIYKMYSF